MSNTRWVKCFCHFNEIALVQSSIPGCVWPNLFCFKKIIANLIHTSTNAVSTYAIFCQLITIVPFICILLIVWILFMYYYCNLNQFWISLMIANHILPDLTALTRIWIIFLGRFDFYFWDSCHKTHVSAYKKAEYNTMENILSYCGISSKCASLTTVCKFAILVAAVAFGRIWRLKKDVQLLIVTSCSI